MLLHRVIAKQPAKRGPTHPVCLHAAEKYEEVHNVNTQNDYKIKSKKWTDKKKTDLFFVFRKCVQILRKQVQDRTKEFLVNKININKKRFLGKATCHSDHYMTNMGGQGPRLAVFDRWADTCLPISIALHILGHF